MAELVPAEMVESLAHGVLPGRMRLEGDVVRLISATGRPTSAVLGAFEPRARCWWVRFADPR